MKRTPDGDGPTLRFDTDARPLPEIPLPNDIATRSDPGSPTGRRLNVSMLAPTEIEARFRRRLDQLDGFSTFGPISASFDAPLDVAALLARHGAGVDRRDDAVFVIDLETGVPVPLDIGGGAYPLTLENPDRYYPFDPRQGGSNLLFETVDEDLDDDGVLDPGEDTDGDGVLDQPNTLTPEGAPEDELLTFYERQTDTLIVHPLVPLRQAHPYAVVITNRVVGLDGEPVRSPFAWVNHLSQTEALRPLADLLPNLELSLDDVAFAWSFTTQTVTRDLEHLRMGFYGRGPFRRLAEEYPPDTNLDRLYDDPDDAPLHPFVVSSEDIRPALEELADLTIGGGAIVEDLFTTFQENVAYVAMGRTTTPVLLDGFESVWELDVARETVRHETSELPWSVIIPRRQGQTGPFPVAIYVHGTGGSRIEAMAFGARMAAHGIATVGFDAYAHGFAFDPIVEELAVGLMRNHGFGSLGEALLDNRTVDLNDDNVEDAAGDFWSADVFHSRDTIRQATVEVMRLVQVLRGFDGQRTWRLQAQGLPAHDGLAGDFDDDGRVDLGGPDNAYFLFGNSLGGIVTGVAAGVEPALVAAAPMSGGGGLANISVRSVQQGVPEAVVLPVMGPLLLGGLEIDGERTIAFHVTSATHEADVPVHAMPDVSPGDRVVLLNLSNGEEGRAVAGEGGTFRVGVAMNHGDQLRLEVQTPDGAAIKHVIDGFDRDVTWRLDTYTAGEPLQAIASGLGIARQTPNFRRLFQLAQTALDPGDPVNYAPHYRQEPLFEDYPGVWRGTHVAVVITVGDMNVPISTGVTLARAAGLIPFDSFDSPHRRLIDAHVLEGLERLHRFAGPPWHDPRAILMDPDNLSEGTDGTDAPRFLEPLRLRATDHDGGVSVVRFFFAEPTGRHSILLPDPTMPFDVDRFALNALGEFFKSRGRQWRDDLCLADDSCE